MIKRLFLLAFLVTCACNAQVYERYLELARQQANAGGGLLPPPLSSNTNPELITGNAAGFDPDESNSTNTGEAPTAATLSVVTVNTGYVGNLGMRIVADATEFSYARHYISGQTGGTTYEYFLLIRSIQGNGAQLKMSDGVGSQTLHNNISSTDWTPYTGTVTIDAGANFIRLEVYANTFFGGDAIGDTFEYKLSLKVDQ